MTKSQELKIALYDYLIDQPFIRLTRCEHQIMRELGDDEEVKEIMFKRYTRRQKEI